MDRDLQGYTLDQSSVEILLSKLEDKWRETRKRKKDSSTESSSIRFHKNFKFHKMWGMKSTSQHKYPKKIKYLRTQVTGSSHWISIATFLGHAILLIIVWSHKEEGKLFWTAALLLKKRPIKIFNSYSILTSLLLFVSSN